MGTGRFVGRATVAGASLFAGSALGVVGWAGVALADSPAASPAATTSPTTTTSPTATAATSCTKSDVVLVSRNADLTTVSVRLASGSSGVSCDVSLHAYETEGPTWPTSGTQRLVGFATAHLTDTPQTLSVTGSNCFGQNDLVIGTTRNDGVDGPAPHYPDRAFASNTIATWIGGSACASPSPTSTSTTTPTSTPTPTPTAPTVVLPTELAVLPPPSSSPPASPSPSVLGVEFQQQPPPMATLPVATSRQLPFTGAPLALEALAAAGLIGVGGVLYSIGRRRSAGRADLSG
ncbi:MAG TPA: hypothetical protein VF218_13665 [Acidothermaceae bacterium]|jgi:hypothetical protein